MEEIVDFSIGKYFTFEEAKKTPIHRWFFYKEGFSPSLIDLLLKRSRMGYEEICDCFCGVGTTLVRGRELCYSVKGNDVSFLSYFVSKVKMEKFNVERLEREFEKIKERIGKVRGFEAIELPKLEFFEWEKIMPKRNLRFLKKILKVMEEMEEKEKEFFMLALLSVVRKSSFIFLDGGVLRIRRRNVPSLKEEFYKKVKEMIKDLERHRFCSNEWGIFLEDARKINYKESVCITSPPYVNAIDYTKVYGVELSFLASLEEIKRIRGRVISSSVFKRAELKELPEKWKEYGRFPIVVNYLRDMEEVLKSLRKGENEVFMVVSNALIYEEHFFIDKELAKIMEELGYRVEIIVGKIRKTRIGNVVREVRESVVHGWLE